MVEDQCKHRARRAIFCAEMKRTGDVLGREVRPINYGSGRNEEISFKLFVIFLKMGPHHPQNIVNSFNGRNAVAVRGKHGSNGLHPTRQVHMRLSVGYPMKPRHALFHEQGLNELVFLGRLDECLDQMFGIAVADLALVRTAPVSVVAIVATRA